jgi:hypothetical protein
MPQRESAARCRHGVPAGLSNAKSADREKGRTTQHSPTQRVQSAVSSTRSGCHGPQESPAMRFRLAPREPWSLTAGQPPQGASQAACRRLASRVIEAWISRRSFGEPVTIL